MTDRYVDGTYAQAHPTWHQEDSPWKASQILAMVERHGLKVGRLAEVGCGAGLITKIVADKLGVTVADGYDLSAQAIAMAGAHASERVRFHNTNLLDSDATYDLVLCIDVFEHIDDYYGFLRALRRSGRQFVFHIPLDVSLSGLLRSERFANARKSMGHVHFFTKDTAIAALEDSGYRIVDTAYTASAMDLSSAHRGWKTSLANNARRLMQAASKDLTVKLLGGYSLLVLADGQAAAAPAQAPALAA